MRASVVCLLAVALVLAPARAGATWLVPPVPGVVLARYDEPDTRWGAGHRGVDLAAAEGSHVTAAAPGVVTFAGTVGSRTAVTVAHGGGFRSTYSDLSEVRVAAGEEVGEGTIVGLAGEAHPGVPGVHFGLTLDGEYVDPLDHLARTDTRGAIHLAPLAWEPPAALAGVITPHAGEGDDRCEPLRVAGIPDVPPNDNVAVAVAGIGSSTDRGVHADIYEHGPEELGYRPNDILRFSYAGTQGPRFHEPYPSSATFGDIRDAARRLRDKLVRVAARHPGREVDLIAHSQGGIVARTFLAEVARSWDPRLPRIDHLVTFASPHEGATGAGEVPELRRSFAGRAIVDAAHRWSRRRGPIPDPLSPAVSQLAPGSPLMTSLAGEELLGGVRGLTLAIPNDVIVPADRARLAGHRNRMVGPTGGRALIGLAARVARLTSPPAAEVMEAFGGRPVRDLNAHSAIVAHPEAQAVAYAFLRNAPASCLRGIDGWGRLVGRGVSALEGRLGDLVSRPEEAAEAAAGFVQRGIEGEVRSLGRAAATVWRIADVLP